MSEDIADLRDTIKPKSDQLNADDLLAGPMRVRVNSVNRGTTDQPISIGIDGQMPFLPCKSMRRVLISAWGDDGRNWIGREMVLYCDPDVKWGGVKVGGIRISHLSDIPADIAMSLTATRGKRTPFMVKALEVVFYPDPLFDERMPIWSKAIKSGTMTPERVIERAEETGRLTEEMKMAIRAVVVDSVELDEVVV